MNACKSIKKHALQESPNEACGLILDNSEIYPCRNDSPNKENHFVVNPKDYVRASLKGNIVAVYHSQSEGNFSELDILSSESHRIKYILYSIKEDKFHEYSPTGVKNSYIGRIWIQNFSECFDLLRDFYQKELRISIKNYQRPTNIFDVNPRIFEDNFKSEDFVKIPYLKENLRKYDVLMMKTRQFNYPSHVGIYLGNNVFLHQPENNISRIDTIGIAWNKRILYLCRHRSLINETIS